MKLVVLISIFVWSNLSFGASKWDRCYAAKQAARNLVNLYVSDDISCSEAKDCVFVNYTGGPVCTNRLVNSQNAEALTLVSESDEYQRLSEIVEKSQQSGLCGPQPRCAAPWRKADCVKGQCELVRHR